MTETDAVSGQEQQNGRGIASVQARLTDEAAPARKKRKSGIPTGNAGEYFVMGELLRRGYDAQLADRNTKAYDLLVGHPEDKHLQKVQVKTVRAQPWYVKQSSFEGELLDQVTVYVMIGKEDGNAPVRYSIARNRDIAGEISIPSNWKDNGFMTLKSLRAFEDRWSALAGPAGVIPPTRESYRTPKP